MQLTSITETSSKDVSHYLLEMLVFVLIHISEEYESYITHTELVMENGKSIRFWDDKWI